MQARMEGRSTDRSGAAGGVYTRHRRVPLARCEKDVAITCPARGNICACAFLVTCLIVTAGLQSLFSSNRDRHTVPDGYTLG